MFAVPGWSLSADALKPQVEEKPSSNFSETKPKLANGSGKKSNKRKRGHGSSEGVNITGENVGDLWTKHIEKKFLADAVDKNLNGVEKRKVGGERERDGVTGEVREIREIDDEAFDGFSEGEDKAVLEIEGEPAKKKKKKRKEQETGDSRLGSSQIAKVEDAPGLGGLSGSTDDGKSKYERRKAQTLRKREQRVLLQANGTIPPDRPASKSGHPNETASDIPRKVTKSSDGPKGKPPVQDSLSATIPDTNKPPQTLPTETPAPPPASTKLTPLQQRMAAKLTSARFRHLNQTLYTTPSDQAMQLFTDSPQAYTSYHAGFRAQVAVWPQNPLDGFIGDIKARGSVSIPSQKKLWRDQKKGKTPKGDSSSVADTNGDSSRNAEPLPRDRHGTCTIADLGCGDATLASSLMPSKKPLNLRLFSFDLAKGDTPNANLITVADISDLTAAGVMNDSVDITICCLSLMGTNWVNVVDECAKVVRGGGEMWVAEIKSRFTRPGLAKKTKGEGIGKKKKKSKDEDVAEDEELADLVEVEGVRGKGGKDETDVSAFVEVFSKRGFNLKGEPDMANKMFVRMRFVKALRAEKLVENEKGGAAKFGDGFKGKQRAKTKFLDEGEEVDESKVLKPCVYKTR